MMKKFLALNTNRMYIMQMEQPFVVSVKREIDKDKIFFILQFSKRIKKKEPALFARLKLDEEAKEIQAPKVIQELLKEFKEVTSTDYPIH